MSDPTQNRGGESWLWWLPPTRWLPEYRAAWLFGDIVAGVTLAAYASLAGLPPQVGIYGYLLGGLGYALFGSSRQLAIGPTSAISLMIAGTVGAMAEGDAQRYAQIASLAALTVAGLSLFAWLLRLSVLVKLVSGSILVGFKTGAATWSDAVRRPSRWAYGARTDRTRRATAARKTGRACGCRSVDCAGDTSGSSGARSTNYGRNPGGFAQPDETISQITR